MLLPWGMSMKFVKKMSFLLLAVNLLFSVNFVQAKEFSTAELERMSIFISNFSELGMTNVVATEVKSNPDLYLRFGIWHNYINNFRSRIAPVSGNESGMLSIEVKYVQESLEKYFNITITDWPSTQEYALKGKSYIFMGADGELTRYAKVTKAQLQPADGTILMEGHYYNAEDEADLYGTFSAVAKPHMWNGKETWALMSLEQKD